MSNLFYDKEEQDSLLIPVEDEQYTVVTGTNEESVMTIDNSQQQDSILVPEATQSVILMETGTTTPKPSVPVGDYVTLDTEQTITGNKDFAGNLTFHGVTVATLDDIDLSNLVDLTSQQTISGLKIFEDQIGIINSSDGDTNLIKHINNNFLITENNGINILNIDEQLQAMYLYNKKIATEEYVNDKAMEGGSGTVVNVGGVQVGTLAFTSDPQQQLDTLDAKIGTASSFNAEIVDQLPTENISISTFYLIKNSTSADDNTYSEYLYVNGKWELLGNTQVQAYDDSELRALINNLSVTKANQSDLDTTNTNVSANATAISNRYTKTEVDGLIDDYLPLAGGDMAGAINHTYSGSTDYSKTELSVNDTSIISTVHKDGSNSPTTVNFGSTSSSVNLRGKNTNPTYNNNDLALKSDVITKTSQLENDAGFITTAPEGVALYETTGSNTDGAMTQKATTDELNKKVSKGTTLVGGQLTQYTTNGTLETTGITPTDVMTLSTAQTVSGAKSFNANNHLIATCNTAYSSTTKTASLTGFTSNHFTDGCEIYVKFVNGNTAGSITSPVTINVNSAGAKTMVVAESATFGSYNQNINLFGQWANNDVIKFRYDATYSYWVAIENVTQHKLYGFANTTLYSTTGTSETAGMTQKAITDALSGKASKSDIPDISNLATKDEIPDISTKADKVSGATADNLASLDANGTLLDSGISKTQIETNTNNIATNTTKINQIANNNLLINGDFKINQRGKTSYSGGGYCVDRWQNSAYGVVTPNSNGGITIKGNGGTVYFCQRIEESSMFVGKTVTFSICLEDGTVYSATDTLQSTAGSYAIKGFTGGQIRIYYYASTGYFGATIDVFNGYTITVKWIKLELGDVATPFVPRPYAEEFLLCQRYYEKGVPYSVVKFARSTNVFYDGGYIPLKVQKRTTPTVSVYSISGAKNYIRNDNGSTDVALNYGNITTNGFMIYSNAGGLTQDRLAYGYYEADAEIQ